MERAMDKFVIGQLVEVIVLNSTYGMVGKVVAFNEHNEYNVKVAFDDGFKEYFERGYMTNELKPIPRLGQKVSIKSKILKFLANSFKSCKNWKEMEHLIA